MLSTAQKLETKSEHTFSSTALYRTAILEGAKERNKEKIDAALEHVSLHAQDLSGHTAAYELTHEGDEDALAFLIINYPEEKISIQRSRINGYMDDQELSKAYQLLDEATGKERFIILQELVYLYASKGLTGAVEQTIALANNPLERHALLQKASIGYSVCGQIELMKNILKSTQQDGYANVVGGLAYCYANENKTQELEALLGSEQHPPARQKIVEQWTFSLVCQGDWEGALTILKSKTTLTQEIKAAIIGLARGCVQKGDFSRQDDLLTLVRHHHTQMLPQVLSTLISSHAATGNVAAVGKLLTYARSLNMDNKLCLVAAIEGYIEGNHLTNAKGIAEFKYETLEDKLALPNLLKPFACMGDSSVVENVLVQHCPSSLIEKVTRHYLTGGHLDLVNKLLAMGSKQPKRIRNSYIELIINTVAEYLYRIGLHLKTDQGIYMVAFFNPEYQDLLVNKLSQFEMQNEANHRPGRQEQHPKLFLRQKNISGLLSEAKSLHPALTAPALSFAAPVNFRYRVGNHWPFLVNWLSGTGQAMARSKKISLDLIFYISAFVLPLTSFEVKYLSANFSMFRATPKISSSSSKTSSPSKRRKG